MWKSESDTNDTSEAVRLYLPILYSRKLAHEPKTCQIGGRPSYFQESQQCTPICSNCKNDMYLLLQLYNATELKTLHVFSCNRATCYNFLETKFLANGGGAVCCRRYMEIVKPLEIIKEKFQDTAVLSPWDTSTDTADTDWGVDAVGETDNLEDMLEKIELHGPKGTRATKQKKENTKNTSFSSNGGVLFSCYEIASQHEPAALKIKDDDDDVGISGGASDAKINAMLAKYMSEEDDVEILTALRGGNGNNSGGGGRREKDERLSADDRVLLAFTDRIKRAPRQVLRYAKGGEPLWSVPLPKKHQSKGGGKQKMNEEIDLPKIPPCPCGAERVFECQLMPSLLHVLEVDKHSTSQEESLQPQNLDQLMHFENGGQNWGAIAIYTCPANCNTSSDEFVLVQDSVDGKPEKRQNGSMVVAVDMDDELDDDDETMEVWDGKMVDEPWSDDDDGKCDN